MNVLEYVPVGTSHQTGDTSTHIRHHMLIHLFELICRLFLLFHIGHFNRTLTATYSRHRNPAGEV